MTNETTPAPEWGAHDWQVTIPNHIFRAVAQSAGKGDPREWLNGIAICRVAADDPVFPWKSDGVLLTATNSHKITFAHLPENSAIDIDCLPLADNVKDNPIPIIPLPVVPRKLGAAYSGRETVIRNLPYSDGQLSAQPSGEAETRTHWQTFGKSYPSFRRVIPAGLEIAPKYEGTPPYINLPMLESIVKIAKMLGAVQSKHTGLGLEIGAPEKEIEETKKGPRKDIWSYIIKYEGFPSVITYAMGYRRK